MPIESHNNPPTTKTITRIDNAKVILPLFISYLENKMAGFEPYPTYVSVCQTLHLIRTPTRSRTRIYPLEADGSFH